mmetsp:Transcript_49882/g.98309  ORF Transcript_49882/g.98309 Transcript_49882/m.98309 type:complete len:97 (+) Transcript_49882:550-840(+)
MQGFLLPPEVGLSSLARQTDKQQRHSLIQQGVRNLIPSTACFDLFDNVQTKLYVHCVSAFSWLVNYVLLSVPVSLELSGSYLSASSLFTLVFIVHK